MSNFCLTTQCNDKYLRQATEIKLRPQDNVLDYLEKYPNAILIIPYTTDEITIKLCKGRAVFALEIDELRYASQSPLSWYWDYPVSDYATFNALVEAGAESIMVQSPLFNDISYVGKSKLRIVPNVSYYETIVRKDGVIGSWIRPEDLKVLDECNIDIVYEFKDCEDRPKKEEGLFRVYSSGEWNGDLNTIITNLNYSADNMLISPDLISRRLTCGQQCQEGRHCKLCYRQLDVANKDFVAKVKESLSERTD